MRALAFVLALPLAACTPSSPPPPTTEPPACSTTATAETARVFEALTPTCVGCHASGARGFFASLDAFQSLVVADPRYVVPGAPDDSGLVKLLLGTATGSFTQMPISGPTYAELVDEGVATLPMDDVRAWIAGLPAQARSIEPDADAPHVTRMSARQIRRALQQQLGLDDADFFIPAEEFGIEMAESRGDDRYPLLSPDDLPMPRQRTTEERHLGLGGASVVRQAREDRSSSPNFVNNLVQLSQAWCGLALAKPGNTALFPSTDAQANEDPAAVKDTLKRWSRLFHAVDLDDAEAGELYTTLFLPLRDDPTGDLTSAWAGTCSYFIRHPRWVFY